MQFKTIAAALVAGLSLATAQAAVIDFNGINVATGDPMVTVPKPYQEDGFTLTTYSGSPYTGYAGGTIYALTPANANWTGSPSVYSGVITNYGSGFQLSRTDGGVFDLISMDAAQFNYPHFTVFGYPAAGGFVQQNFVLDNSYDTLQTLTLDSRFKNLTMIQFSSVYAQVDNIQLSYPGEVIAPPPSAVPEADSLALALAGLGVAGWRLRRRAR